MKDLNQLIFTTLYLIHAHYAEQIDILIEPRLCACVRASHIYPNTIWYRIQ